MEHGVDQTSKKVISVLVRALLVQFNGISNENSFFVTKKSNSSDQDELMLKMFGSASLADKSEQLLSTFNTKLIKDCSANLFI